MYLCLLHFADVTLAISVVVVDSAWSHWRRNEDGENDENSVDCCDARYGRHAGSQAGSTIEYTVWLFGAPEFSLTIKPCARFFHVWYACVCNKKANSAIWVRTLTFTIVSILVKGRTGCIALCGCVPRRPAVTLCVYETNVSYAVRNVDGVYSAWKVNTRAHTPLNGKGHWNI